METNSTINERWKLCTLVSFMGCFILLLCLQNHQDGVNLSTIRNVTIMISQLSESSSMRSPEFSSSSRFIENEVSMNEITEEICDIFDGKWVYKTSEDPPYDEFQCPFLSDQVSCQRNGRPDFDYENWSWEAKNCEIPRFNGRDMLERLRGKRVIIVGDSLNRNQWESLVCLLYSSIPSPQAHVEVQSGVYKVFKAKEYNCTVEFYWSPFLVQLDTSQDNGTKLLSLNKVAPSAQHWRGADIMVFNTGHWWLHRKAWDLFEYRGKIREEMEIETAFAMAMKTWAHWVDKNVDKTKMTVVFRSISPEHKGDQWCYNVTQPITDESYIQTFPKPLLKVVERVIGKMKTPVKYLNITKLSQYRRDAHPTVYMKKMRNRSESFADCSHWCLPGLPDTWNRLLYSLLVFDNSRETFGS